MHDGIVTCISEGLMEIRGVDWMIGSWMWKLLLRQSGLELKGDEGLRDIAMAMAVFCLARIDKP